MKFAVSVNLYLNRPPVILSTEVFMHLVARSLLHFPHYIVASSVEKPSCDITSTMSIRPVGPLRILKFVNDQNLQEQQIEVNFQNP